MSVIPLLTGLLNLELALNDLVAWLGVTAATLTLGVAYATYRAQRGKLSLEYVITSNYRIIPEPKPSNLNVVHGSRAVPDAHLAVMRLVNTGDKAITPDDFSSSIVITLGEAREVVVADVTYLRPAGLEIVLSVSGNEVHLAPTLINPGDMVQVQFLTSSAATFTVSGRVANLSKISRRDALPYPPGTGIEGEMLGFDKFMWYIAHPVAIIACGLLMIWLITGFVLTIDALLIACISVAVLGIYFMRTNYLVKRRRRWGVH